MELTEFPTASVSAGPSSLLKENEKLRSEKDFLLNEKHTMELVITTRELQLEETWDKLTALENEHPQLLDAVSRLKERVNKLLRSNKNTTVFLERAQLKNFQLKRTAQQQQELIDILKKRQKQIIAGPKMPPNNVILKNFELKARVETITKQNAKLSKKIESQRDAVTRYLNSADQQKNEEIAETKQDENESHFTESKSNTERKIARCKKRVEELKDKLASQREAQVNFMHECFENDYKYQYDRIQRYKTFSDMFSSKLGLKTDDGSGGDEQQGTDGNKVSVDSSSKEGSFADDSETNAIVKVPTSPQASLPEPTPPVSTLNAVEKPDSEHVDVDAKNTDIQGNEPSKEFRCNVCNMQFKTKTLLENHQIHIKCGKSIKTENATTTTTDLIQEQSSPSCPPTAVDKKTTEHIKQETHDDPPLTSSSRKEKSATSKEAVSNHRKDEFRNRNEDGFYCVCGIQWPTDTVLELHIKQPNRIITFRCKYCDMKVEDFAKLKEHLLTIHKYTHGIKEIKFGKAK